MRQPEQSSGIYSLRQAAHGPVWLSRRDVDWEYSGAPERGGNEGADTRNLVLLVQEMRAAYGTSCGISLTLAPDFW